MAEAFHTLRLAYSIERSIFFLIEKPCQLDCTPQHTLFISSWIEQTHTDTYTESLSRSLYREH